MADNTRINDLQEKLLQAMDILNAKALSEVSFDKTIVCTIEGDTDKEQGKYLVSDGVKTFTAYTSDTKLRNKDNVYVTIPEGNFENQKIIIGKKLDEQAKPFVFTSPFDTIFDMTDNVVASKVQDGALVANALNKYGNDNYEYITLYDNICNFYGYTRLGIKANFKSWIKNAVRGNYGLAIILTTHNVDIASNQKIEEQKYYYTFSNEDMYGNTYDFETDYEQQLVIPLEEISGTITNITINFYQEANFFDEFNEPIECSEKGYKLKNDNTNQYDVDADGDYQLSEGDTVLEPNIFVKNIYMCFGYDISIFTNDMVQIYTQQSSTYKHSNTASNNGVAQNRKNIKMRWIHIDENGKPVDMIAAARTKVNEVPYEVRWYRYKIGAPASDAYCGVYWTRIEDVEGFEYAFDPNIDLQQEKIKAIIIYNSTTPYYSNELLFENEENLPPSAEAQHIATALTIITDDGTNGNYMIYGQDNSIKDTDYGKTQRYLSVWFDADSNGELTENEKIQDPKQNENITWTFPAQNTMIELLGDKIEIKENEGTEQEKIIAYQIHAYNPCYKISSYYSPNKFNNTIVCEYLLNGRVYTTEKEFTFGPAGTMGTDQTLVIDFIGDKTAVDTSDEVVSIIVQLYDNQNIQQQIPDGTVQWAWYYNSDISQNDLPYQINNSTNATINIDCKDLQLNGLYILQATIGELTAYFPIPMTNGYKYIKGPTQVIYQANGEPTYNRENYELSPSTNKGIKWRIRVDREYYKYEIAEQTSEEEFENGRYYILKNNKYSWANPETNGFLEEQIYYLRSKIMKKCYLDQITSEIKTLDSVNSNEFASDIIKYMPSLSNDYKLKPLGIYVEDAPIYGIQALVDDTVVWSQPILVLQNKWPNGVINAWAGESLQLDEDNGIILSAAIAAGKKHSEDNTFSGVMMGDWSQTDAQDSIAKTGLYGFHHGDMSYAFKEDGTGFIGKSSMARINFDGSEATIYSAGYKDTINNPGGMMINLYNDGEPFIELKSKVEDGTSSTMRFDTKNSKSEIKMTLANLDGKSRYIRITNADSNTNPLTIGDDFSVGWKGDIKANSGKIGNWIIETSGEAKGALRANDNSIILNTQNNGSIIIGNSPTQANNITITGGHYEDEKYIPSKISGGVLSSNSDTNRIKLDGYLEVSEFGILGKVYSNLDNTPESAQQPGIGMEWWYHNHVTGNGKLEKCGEIKTTLLNTAMRFLNNYISITNTEISLGGPGPIDKSNLKINFNNIKPENQHGIYARFA